MQALATAEARPKTDKAQMEKKWYIVHAYSNFERKVADSIREKAAAAGLGDAVRGDPRADREGRRGAARPQGRCRAQVLPGLRAGEDGDDGRGLPPDQEHAEGHRLPRRRQQADADLRSRGAAHPAAGAGGRRAPEAVDQLRDRRAGARLGRPVRLVQRHRSRKSTRSGRASRSPCRSSAGPLRSSSNTVRSRRSDPLRQAQASASVVGGEGGLPAAGTGPRHSRRPRRLMSLGTDAWQRKSQAT